MVACIRKVEILYKSDNSKYSHDDNGIQCTASDFEDQSINDIGVSLYQKMKKNKETMMAIKNVYDIDYPYGTGMMGRLTKKHIQAS